MSAAAVQTAQVPVGTAEQSMQVAVDRVEELAEVKIQTRVQPMGYPPEEMAVDRVKARRGVSVVAKPVGQTAQPVASP
jgi:uncharacterized protein YqgV (UPF0045/DUF77 family)